MRATRHFHPAGLLIRIHLCHPLKPGAGAVVPSGCTLAHFFTERALHNSTNAAGEVARSNLAKTCLAMPSGLTASKGEPWNAAGGIESFLWCLRRKPGCSHGITSDSSSNDPAHASSSGSVVAHRESRFGVFIGVLAPLEANCAALSAVAETADGIEPSYMGMSAGMLAIASCTAVTVMVSPFTLPSTWTCLPAKGAMALVLPVSV